jgi:hypothetical protein
MYRESFEGCLTPDTKAWFDPTVIGAPSMSARAILLGVSKLWPFAARKNENKNKTPSNLTHSGSYTGCLRLRLF